MMGIKIPWQVWALSGLLLIFFGWGKWQHHKGAAAVQLKWDQAVDRGKVLVAELQAGQDSITTITEIKYIDRVETVYEKGKTIIKQIPVYVPTDSCELGGGFRVLHDAAAANTIPDPARIPDAPSVPAPTLATTITENYTECTITASKLVALQQWWKDQAALIAERCKQPGVHCSKDK